MDARKTMAPSRMAAYLVVAVLFAAWLASAAGTARRPRTVVVPRAAPRSARVDSLAVDVQSQAARLRKRLAAAPAPQAPVRNPFLFADRSAPVAPRAPRRSEPIVATDVLPPQPIEPDLSLLGIAEQQTDNGILRTAMIGGIGDDLFMVVAGQTVVGRYRVMRVGADTVELRDEMTGATKRLALKSPI